MASYDKPKAGEWVRPIHNGYKLACCDCGLVHRIDFRINEGSVEMKLERDKRATGQMRRHIKRAGCK